MKRLVLLGLLVPAFAVACGGSEGGGSDSELAQAPTAPPAAPTSEPAEAAGDESMEGEPMDGESMDSGHSAPAEAEEIGEQRGLDVEDEGGEMSAGEEAPPAAEEPAAEEGTPREEDTSRPVAPVITGSTLDGEPISLEDFKGRPVIVKVFAEH